MANNAVAPIILYSAISSSVVTLTFGRQVGSVIIKSLGANRVWVRWDGTAPVASLGDGRWPLDSGEAMNLGEEQIETVKAICAAGNTCDLMVLGYAAVAGAFKGAT